MAESLICNNTQSRVSSVLNRDVRQFGKKFMFDSNEETCWNSDQGESQWVVLEFPQPVKVSELRLQFQGGFSGKSCKLEVSHLNHIKQIPSKTMIHLSTKQVTALIGFCKRKGSQTYCRLLSRGQQLSTNILPRGAIFFFSNRHLLSFLNQLR
uniref:Nuclear receptor 2C2-associated protein n=1 Tax=Cyprinus carpio carpio TaxID=630221 RepID=A0A9J8A7X8_CYPCA